MKMLQSDTVVMSPPARARERTLASSAHPAHPSTGAGSRSRFHGSSIGGVLYRVGSFMARSVAHPCGRICPRTEDS